MPKLNVKVANVDKAAVLICSGFEPFPELAYMGSEKRVVFKNTPKLQKAIRDFRTLDMTAGAWLDVRNLLLDMFKGAIPFNSEVLMRAAQKDAA